MTRIPVTRCNPDGSTTDGTAELFGPAVLSDLRTLDGVSFTLGDGSMLHFDLDDTITIQGDD